MEDLNDTKLLNGSEEALDRALERLTAAAEMLERAVEVMTEREGALTIEGEASIEKIVATVEARRGADLAERLAAAEAELLAIRAKASSSAVVERGGRKTLPAGMATLLMKQGVAVDSLEAGALDAALVSLSLEQRIAVKAQLLRSGLVG